MSDLTLAIEIDPELPVYQPGSILRGRVKISSPTGPWKAESMELVIFWRTSGVGDRDQGVGTTMPLSEKGAEIPASFWRDFEIQLPLHPYSYNGTLIKINWFIGLRIKKGWLSRQEIELPIEIKPHAAVN